MKLFEIRLDDVYRSDQRYDKMGAAQSIVDWYDEVFDVGGYQKEQLDELFQAYGVAEEDPDEMFRKLLRLQPQDLNKLYRNTKKIMERR